MKSARGVDDEERCCGQCGRGRRAEKSEFSLIDKSLFRSRIYTICGKKVKLDADLAKIYEYSTKDFNGLVKKNIAKFTQLQF